MALDPVVGIVVGVGVHLPALKPVPINSAWSKTYILTPKSSFYDVHVFCRFELITTDSLIYSLT